MMSTQTNNNSLNVAAAPQPVFVQVMPAPPTLFNFAPVMPAMSATPAPSLTPLLPLPPTLTKVTNVPVSTMATLMYYDGSGLSQLPAYLTPTISQGVLTPPTGFSFATLNFSPQLPVVADSDSTGNVEDLANTSPEPTPEPVAPKDPAQKARKFKHGSKQERIMEVYNAIQQKYTAQGVYAGEHEVLRGADTVRVHVKTYKGLNKIQAALQEVDDCPDVRLRKLATPFSMKNRFQKKGFIVYLRLESPDMVESVKAVFKKYEEFFRKCDVAMPKPTDPQPNEPVDNKISDFFDVREGSDAFFPMPLPMVKQTSAPGNAA